MSKFNEKWFKHVESLPTEEMFTFKDFIFHDGLKRKINLTKIKKNAWLFIINCSEQSNESCYGDIIKNETREKTWFKIINPTLDKINEKISSINICKYHITCQGICELELINSDKDDCPICLKEFEKHYFTRTVCGHYFCLPCLNSLVQEDRKYKDDDDETYFYISCPLCRENICTM